MHIDQLTLKNFRNFENVDIPLNSKMNTVCVEFALIQRIKNNI